MWDLLFCYKKNINCKFFCEKERFYLQFNQNNNIIVYVNNSIRFILTYRNKNDFAKLYYNKKNADLELLTYISNQYFFILNNIPVIHCFSLVYNDVLICIHGSSGIGKSTSGNFMIENLPGSKLYSEDYLPYNNKKAVFSGFFYKKEQNYYKNNNICNKLHYKKILNIFLDENTNSEYREVQKPQAVLFILKELHNMRFVEHTCFNIQSLMDNISEFAYNSQNILILYKKNRKSLKNILKYVKTIVTAVQGNFSDKI